MNMTIEAIFTKIKDLLLEWSGQLIFLGLSVYADSRLGLPTYY
jgi:hypothetical protein